MKNLIVATLVTLAMVAAPVMAYTNIWSHVENEGGYTSYQDETMVGGYDWSECSYQYTGIVTEGFENWGEIEMSKELHSHGNWIAEEKKTITGSGDTELFKHVNVWTEDKTVDGGKLKYPTKAWVEYVFTTPKPFYDADTWYVNMDEPPAQDGAEYGNHGYYDKFIETDEDFNFGQKWGIGDFPSDFEPITPPTFPSMCWFCC